MRTALALIVGIVGLGTAAAQAAPKADFREPMLVDKYLEIFHPEELVGPPVDPSGPFRQVSEPEPDPWIETPVAVDKVIIQR